MDPEFASASSATDKPRRSSPAPCFAVVFGAAPYRTMPEVKSSPQHRAPIAASFPAVPSLNIGSIAPERVSAGAARRTE